MSRLLTNMLNVSFQLTELALSSVLVTTLHESAHAFSATRQGAKIRYIRIGHRLRLGRRLHILLPFGGATGVPRRLPARARLWPLLAGPATSCVLALVLTVIHAAAGPESTPFLWIPTGLATCDALINTLPFPGSDGYRFCYFMQNQWGRCDPPEPHPPYPRLKNTLLAWVLSGLAFTAAATITVVWLALPL